MFRDLFHIAVGFSFGITTVVVTACVYMIEETKRENQKLRKNRSPYENYYEKKIKY